MARSTPVATLAKLVQQLHAERQDHVDAIAEIDSSFDALGINSQNTGRGRRPQNGRRKGSAAKKRATATGGRRRFKRTGEELVMSLVSLIGPRPNLLGYESTGTHMRLEVSQPILTNTDIERIRHIEDHTGGAFRTHTIDICYDAALGADGMEGALKSICRIEQSPP